MFRSTKHPHVTMNRYGVLLVPNGHPDGVTYYGKSFPQVPMESQPGVVRNTIEQEAIDAGYQKKYLGNGEVLWSKAAPITRFREEECGGAFDGFSVTSDADSGL